MQTHFKNWMSINCCLYWASKIHMGIVYRAITYSRIEYGFTWMWTMVLCALWYNVAVKYPQNINMYWSKRRFTFTCAHEILIGTERDRNTDREWVCTLYKYIYCEFWTCQHWYFMWKFVYGTIRNCTSHASMQHKSILIGVYTRATPSM